MIKTSLNILYKIILWIVYFTSFAQLMPVKKSTKANSKSSEISEKQVSSKSDNKKETTKKVIVKRRKVDLKPTKASAVAIAAQANRAKKQALIEKVATSENVPPTKMGSSSDSKIPLWVRIFFWCSLLFFCVTFYRYEIYPQLGGENVVVDDSLYWTGRTNTADNITQDAENNQMIINDEETDLGAINVEVDDVGSDQWMSVSDLAIKVVEKFFDNLSNRKFDDAFSLLVPALQASSEIREHFTSVRMNPFLDWIEWWTLKPVNFGYVGSSSYWRDVYKFDLSYVMSADQSSYDETWEFTVNTQWNEPKISSIRCTTSKCSYHPIFWPENFGLIR